MNEKQNSNKNETAELQVPASIENPQKPNDSVITVIESTMNPVSASNISNVSGENAEKSQSTHIDAHVADNPYHLDQALPLDPKLFPNPANGNGSIPATITNVQDLLRSYGIDVRYNIVKKKLRIILPGHSGTTDNADNVAITQIISLATLNGIATGQIPSYVEAIADQKLHRQ